MSRSAESKVPELIEGVDVRQLPLTAVDGFVLSRIDGRTTTAEIAALTGLPPDNIAGILEKLITLGAIRWKEEAGRSARPSDRAARRRAGKGSERPARSRGRGSGRPRPLMAESPISDKPPRAGGPSSSRPTKMSRVPTQPRMEAAPERRAAGRPSQPSPAVPSSIPPVSVSTRPPYDERELHEEVDLPLERRRQVLALYYRIEEITFYDALGVPQDADKKEIRAAYFKLSKVFHPDTMFRKELGSFKPKMEKVFKHLTEAYETLGKKKKRKEYDAYLKATRRTVSVQRVLDEHKAASESPAVPDQPRPAASSPSPSTPPRRPEPAPARSEVTPAHRKLAQEVVTRRLRALRRSGAPPTQPRASQPAPATTPEVKHTPADPRAAARDLARVLQQTKGVAKTDLATVHVRKARAAEAEGDLLKATAEMRKAISEAPERADLHVEHQRLSELLARELASDYEAQATFEQGQGKWASAALSWAKVVEGRPDDASAARNAAHALLRAGGDLHKARTFAQKAVQLNPRDLEARVVLARVYLNADLQLNARRELESAAKLDPNNEMVKNLLADLKA